MKTASKIANTTSTARDVANLPLEFLDSLARAKSLYEVLGCTSYWVKEIFQSDRASITLQHNDAFLKLYSLTGNDVIPVDRLIPIQGTFVGRVYSQKKLAICADNRAADLLDCRWLAEGGLLSCMDAPLVSEGTCFGTLNLAHKQLGAYDQHDARVLGSLASWVAAQIQAKKRVQDLEQLAKIDPLTGTLNRRAFFEATQYIGNKPRHHDQQLALLMIDLDAFKSVNDQYGHLAGDEVLKAVSQKLKSNTRRDDILARFGGEEFALLLRNVEHSQAMCIAENLREHIQRLSIPYHDQVVSLTASIGLALYHPQDKCFNDLMYRADNALYQAKAQGRNRVVFQAKPV